MIELMDGETSVEIRFKRKSNEVEMDFAVLIDEIYLNKDEDLITEILEAKAKAEVSFNRDYKEQQ